jgi:hypothetical protein
MLKDLATSSKHVKTLSFPQTSIETSSESDGNTEIQKIEEAFSNLELNRIHKPKVTPTTLTKNWYPRPTWDKAIYTYIY